MAAVGVGQREGLAKILEERRGLGSWGCQGEILGRGPGRRSGAVGRGPAGCGLAAGPPGHRSPFLRQPGLLLPGQVSDLGRRGLLLLLLR